MKKNTNSVDRIVRVLIAAVIAILYLNNIISGTLGILLVSLAVIFVITSFISFCPIYAILGTSTRKKKLNA